MSPVRSSSRPQRLSIAAACILVLNNAIQSRCFVLSTEQQATGTNGRLGKLITSSFKLRSCALADYNWSPPLSPKSMVYISGRARQRSILQYGTATSMDEFEKFYDPCSRGNKNRNDPEETFETALCIVPPTWAWDRLQRARHQARDPCFHEWPPAIRLFHPFSLSVSTETTLPDNPKGGGRYNGQISGKKKTDQQ